MTRQVLTGVQRVAVSHVRDQHRLLALCLPVLKSIVVSSSRDTTQLRQRTRQIPPGRTFKSISIVTRAIALPHNRQ